MLEQTLRQQMILLLSEEAYSIRELSQSLGVSEKEVLGHLSHIARSVSRLKKRFVTTPPACLTCGYLFRKRKRFNRPSRCPSCRGERIQVPEYQII